MRSSTAYVTATLKYLSYLENIGVIATSKVVSKLNPLVIKRKYGNSRYYSLYRMQIVIKNMNPDILKQQVIPIIEDNIQIGSFDNEFSWELSPSKFDLPKGSFKKGGTVPKKDGINSTINSAINSTTNSIGNLKKAFQSLGLSAKAAGAQAAFVMFENGANTTNGYVIKDNQEQQVEISQIKTNEIKTNESGLTKRKLKFRK